MQITIYPQFAFICSYFHHVIVEGCTELIAEENDQVFTSHANYGSDNYDNNFSDCWVITAPEGYYVHANVETPLSLENCNDTLEAWCGADDLGDAIAMYCDGDSFSAIRSSSNQMYFEFNTDSEGVAAGFKIFYSYTDTDNPSCGAYNEDEFEAAFSDEQGVQRQPMDHYYGHYYYSTTDSSRENNNNGGCEVQDNCPLDTGFIIGAIVAPLVIAFIIVPGIFVCIYVCKAMKGGTHVGPSRGEILAAEEMAARVRLARMQQIRAMEANQQPGMQPAWQPTIHTSTNMNPQFNSTFQPPPYGAQPEAFGSTQATPHGTYGFETQPESSFGTGGNGFGKPAEPIVKY